MHRDDRRNQRLYVRNQNVKAADVTWVDGIANIKQRIEKS